MSELTRCNRCTLDLYERRHPGRVSTRLDAHGWIEVLVDGEPIGAHFLTLSEECVC